MRILIESLLVALLGLPLGIPWIAIPFAILRSIVGGVEAQGNAEIDAGGGPVGAIALLLLVGVPSALLLFALMGAGMGL